MKDVFLFASLLLVISLGAGCAREEGLDYQQAQKADLIQVDNLPNGARIKSPLTVTGKARGTWFFEATFPVQLRDGNGKKIVETYAQAEGEWMTTEFVSWKTTLTYPTPSTPTGTVVFLKDNPSGERAFDDQLAIPVRF